MKSLLKKASLQNYNHILYLYSSKNNEFCSIRTIIIENTIARKKFLTLKSTQNSLFFRQK